MGAMRSVIVLGGIILAGCGGEKAGEQAGAAANLQYPRLRRHAALGGQFRDHFRDNGLHPRAIFIALCRSAKGPLDSVCPLVRHCAPNG